MTSHARSAAPLALVLPSDGRFDARAWRIAATVAARGRDVELVARSAPGLAAEEVVESHSNETGVEPGHIRLRRVGRAGAVRGGSPSSAAFAGAARGPVPPGAIAERLRRALEELRRILLVIRSVLDQRRAARPELGGAGLVHAMGVLALPVALAARDGRQPRGVRRPVVYDARDIYAEARNIARLPSPLRWLFGVVEGHWARQADAVVTVNDVLAAQLLTRLRPPLRPIVVHNCPPRWDPPAAPVDRLRTAVGISPGTPVALYHGGFSRDRGMEQLAAAIHEPGLEAIHVVYLGYGALEPALRAMAAEPAAAGRVHVLPAVSPDELLDWVTSADVAVLAIQPTTLNHRLSTPNKLFEAIAAGVPVVASDFVAIREVVLNAPAGPLGVLVDPTDPRAIAAGIRSILEASAEDRAAMRARCLRAAHDRWNWEAQSSPLLELYGRLTGDPW